jgi:hypothetical protein
MPVRMICVGERGILSRKQHKYRKAVFNMDVYERMKELGISLPKAPAKAEYMLRSRNSAITWSIFLDAGLQ